ncbi:MAG: SBBP repeat-containing protein, partial [Flavobacteriales bacterium]|nr:SBBP repeat-containing protein [Flavobacteriales bacterium]
MKFLYTLFLTATIALFSCNFAKANDTFFIENKGQVKNEKGQLDQSVLFTYATSEMEVFVRKNGLTYQFKRYDGEGVHAERVDVNWKGASESAVSKSLRSVYSENYILDGEWIKARAFQEVFIANVYPGVDWRMYITESGLKYEFIAENAAAAKQIKMQVEGAEELEKCTNGSLLIKAEMGQVSDAKPVYFNQGKEIDGNFILNENAIQFEIPSHTKGELILDPEVIWSSYYGGTGLDDSRGIFTDANGDYYLTGATNSTTLISYLGYQGLLGGSNDVYVVKFNALNQRLWATYYGRTGNDVGNDIVVDPYGGIYVAGSTSSMSAFASASQQTVYGGGPRDGFVLKLFPDGTLEWCSYYGGSGDEQLTALSLGFQGEVYFIGETSSTDLITLDPLQAAFGGGASDFYIGTIDPGGFLLRYTYFGGSGAELAGDLVATSDFNLYFTGTTSSSAGMATGGEQNTFGGGAYDGFFAKINSGNVIEWASYIGGPSEDRAEAIHVAADRLYVVGKSGSINGISTPGAAQVFNGGGSFDGYLASYTIDGSVNWKTYYGGSGNESLWGVVTDAAGSVFITGNSTSSNLGDNGFQNANGGLNDIVFAGYSIDGVRYWSSYLGGSADESVSDLVINANQEMFFAGSSASLNLAVGGYTAANNGGGEAFFGKLKNCDYPYLTVHITGDTIFCDGKSAVLCAGGADHFLWSTGDTTAALEVTDPITVFLIGTSTVGCSTRSDDYTFTVLPQPSITITADGPLTFCGNASVNLTASGGENYEWNSGPLSQTITVTESGNYSCTGTNEYGCEGSSNQLSVEVFDLPEVAMGISTDSICISADPVGIVGLPLGGTYVGDGIVGSTIDPTIAGGGAHQVYYTYTDANGCANSSEVFDYFVLFEPTVLFLSQDTVMAGDPPV